MKLENRYVVFKLTDIAAALNDFEREALDDLIVVIGNYRLDSGKPLLNTIVIESDWPEYEDTVKALESRINREQGVQLRESEKTNIDGRRACIVVDRNISGWYHGPATFLEFFIRPSDSVVLAAVELPDGSVQVLGIDRIKFVKE